MSADGPAVHEAPTENADDKPMPSMSALLAAGEAAHAVCTPPAAPEGPEPDGDSGQPDAA